MEKIMVYTMTTREKKIVMAIISIISTTLSYGIPTNWLKLKVFGIVLIGVFLSYLGKNLLFPSKSVCGTLDWRDIISGAFIAVSSALISWAADAVNLTTLDWKALGTLVVTMTGGYLIKTLKGCDGNDLSTN